MGKRLNLPIAVDVLKSCVERGLSTRALARELKVSATTINWYLSKYGLKTKPLYVPKQPKWLEELPSVVARSECWADVIRGVGLSIRPGSYDTIKRWCTKKGISTRHFSGKSHGRSKTRVFDNNSLFVVDSTAPRKSIKKRILKDGLIEYVCSECGSPPTWRGKNLTLILDHINGDYTDCRLDNLRFLCPNCNSQQETFCRKRLSS